MIKTLGRFAANLIGRLGLFFFSSTLLLGALWWAGTVSSTVAFKVEVALGLGGLWLAVMPGAFRWRSARGFASTCVVLLAAGNAVWSYQRARGWENPAEMVMAAAIAACSMLVVIANVRSESQTTNVAET